LIFTPTHFPIKSRRARWRTCWKIPEPTNPLRFAQAHTDATLAGLTASSRAAGLDISLVLPIAYLSQALRKRSTTLPPLRTNSRVCALFGSVHPLNPQAQAEVHRIRELGLRGIKLHPEYQNCYADSPEVIAVVRAAAECGLA